MCSIFFTKESIMTNVFCRGCGTTIHETAPICPKCGAPQKIEKYKLDNSSNERIIASLLGIFFRGNWVA